MLALLAYPLFVEPSWSLPRQSQNWTILYALFFVLIAAAGLKIWRLGALPLQAVHAHPGDAVTWRRRLGWLLLAAMPSSLMLGTSTYIANDIASVPLFWVVPLALYLLTFVISFQDKPVIPYASALRWQMVFAAMAGVLLCLPTVILMLNLMVFLGALFFGALICHQTLALDRPHESRLTEFYLLIAAGGVLGGIFNSLLAPLLFRTVLEFQLVLALICLARPGGAKAGSRDVIVAALGVAMAIAIAFVSVDAFKGAALVVAGLAIASGIAAVAVSQNRSLFALVIGALCAQAALIAPLKNPGLLTIRSFFGVSRVVTMTDPTLGPVHVLYHGTTIHGAQSQIPARRCVPETYFAPSTPIGETIIRLQRNNPSMRIGVVGLGAGTIAAYTRAADRMRYFEIDPAVARIAGDPHYFTYLSQCAQGKVDVVLGDARLTLSNEGARQFDLVILDAFSADNIPTHLLTREAFALYFRVLKDGGVVMLHITNRNLALEGPAAATAKAAGALARIKIFTPPKDPSGLVMARSKVMAMSKSQATLDAVTSGPGWRTAEPRDLQPWTDEYTNVAGALYDHVARGLP
jgi:SAM-dependent methyltransferase